MARKNGLDARDWFTGQSFVSSARERIYERIDSSERTERTYNYDLYNTTTEQIEATDRFTPSVARRRNALLAANQEPQRWIPTPMVTAYQRPW
jgi:hypothetical protein